MPQVKRYLTSSIENCIRVVSRVVEQLNTKYLRKLGNIRKISKLGADRA